MNCTMRFGNCFLCFPLMYQACCIVPRSQRQVRGSSQNSLQYLRVQFILSPSILVRTWPRSFELSSRGTLTGRMCKFCLAKSRCLVTFQLLFSRGCHADLVLVLLFGAVDPLFPSPHATCDSFVGCADGGLIWIWEGLRHHVVRAIASLKWCVKNLF